MDMAEKKRVLHWLSGDIVAAVAGAIGGSELAKMWMRKAGEVVSGRVEAQVKELTTREKAGILFRILREMSQQDTQHIVALLQSATRGGEEHGWSEDHIVHLLFQLLPSSTLQKEEKGKKQKSKEPPKNPYQGVKEDLKFLNDKLGGSEDDRKLAFQMLYLLDADGLQQLIAKFGRKANRALAGSPEEIKELRQRAQRFLDKQLTRLCERGRS